MQPSSETQSTPLFLVAAALAGLAGFVDALAYASLGGFFASFMSGNTTRLAIGLSEHLYGDVLTAASLLLSFLSGVILAAVVNERWPRWRGSGAMLLVTGLLVLAAAAETIDVRAGALVFLAGAMGAENGVFARHGNIRVGLTYMTGTLIRFGQRLAAMLMGSAGQSGWHRDLILWLGFLAGAAAGAFAWVDWRGEAYWAAAALAALMTIGTALLPQRMYGD